MREWLAFGVGGTCTALGVVEVACGAVASHSMLFGAMVLLLIFALSYSNVKLWEP